MQDQELKVHDFSKKNDEKLKELEAKQRAMDGLKMNIVETQKNINEVEENLKLIDCDIKRMVGFKNSNISTIKNLEGQTRRQAEIIYEKEFQIQKMEGRVAKQKGDMSEEEKKAKEKEIDEVSTVLKKLVEKNQMIEKSLRGIKEESKKLEVSIGTVKKDIEG